MVKLPVFSRVEVDSAASKEYYGLDHELRRMAQSVASGVGWCEWGSPAEPACPESIEGKPYTPRRPRLVGGMSRD